MRVDAAAVMQAWRLVHRQRDDEALACVRALYEAARAQHDPFDFLVLARILRLWGDLAQRHAPAHAALVQVRNELAADLLAAPDDRQLFARIVSVNAKLQDDAHTRALFLQLRERDAALATTHAHAVIPALIAVGDFALAECLLPFPEQLVREESAYLNREIASRRGRPHTAAPRIPASIHNYAAEIRKVVTVLEGRGRRADARRILAMAVEAVVATTIRDAVRTALLPGAKPWYERGRPNDRKFYLNERRSDRQAVKTARRLHARSSAPT